MEVSPYPAKTYYADWREASRWETDDRYPGRLYLMCHGLQIGWADVAKDEYRQCYYWKGELEATAHPISRAPVPIPAKLLGQRAEKKAAPAPQRKTMLSGPHRCTCGCEETGVCRCPNCSVGCGFLPPPEKKKE